MIIIIIIIIIKALIFEQVQGSFSKDTDKQITPNERRSVLKVVFIWHFIQILSIAYLTVRCRFPKSISLVRISFSLSLFLAYTFSYHNLLKTREINNIAFTTFVSRPCTPNHRMCFTFKIRVNLAKINEPCFLFYAFGDMSRPEAGFVTCSFSQRASVGQEFLSHSQPWCGLYI